MSSKGKQRSGDGKRKCGVVKGREEVREGNNVNGVCEYGRQVSGREVWNGKGKGMEGNDRGHREGKRER